MNAILTYSGVDKKTKKRFVEARTASGKKARIYIRSFRHCLNHEDAAISLSVRLGWGANLIGGETKEGFAFIPIQEPKKPETTQDEAAQLIGRVASNLTPSFHDPIKIATGIKVLANASRE